jgi:YVTN family beta-propeller protein
MLRRARFLVCLLLVLLGALASRASSGPVNPAEAAFSATLPTGTLITPAGSEVRQLDRLSGSGDCAHCIGLLPLELALSPSGRWLATADSGTDSKTISIVDVTTNTVSDHLNLNLGAFMGVAWVNDDTLYVSGGSYGMVYVVKRAASGPFSLSQPYIPVGNFPAGMTTSSDQRYVYVVNDMSNNLDVIDTATRAVIDVVPTGDHPYTVVARRDRLYVSNWGGNTVSAYQLADAGHPVPLGISPNPGGFTDYTTIAPIPDAVGAVAHVGAHPSAMALSADERTLYVTDGNDDAVSVVDTRTMTEASRVRVAPVLAQPNAVPLSSAPGALALAGNELFVANGGNNALAVIDTAKAVSSPGQALLGYLPTGWYPSALQVVGTDLYYANAKGDGPNTSSAGGTGVLFQGRGVPPTGSVWHIPVSDAMTNLRTYTGLVAEDNNWTSLPGNTSGGTALSNIHHVIYVLRENKTFDEEFSDVPQADGRQCQTPGEVATYQPSSETYSCPDGKPSLLVYGKEITPNNHALARKYALLNDFDVDAETSIIGHQWSTASQLSDFAQKVYGNDTQWTSQEPGTPELNGAFDMSYPGGGYLFDAVLKAGKTARAYSGGYDAADVSGRTQNVQKIVDNVDLLVPLGIDSGLYPDTLRVNEFSRDVNLHGLANYSFIWLPDDHTVGGLPRNLNPQSQVATNDLATGQLVDFVSHSRYWADTAIFVNEDDPQSGRDHISGYRSIFMVASPYAKRGYVSNGHYDQSALIRTIEQILGVQPISQNDETIASMSDLFTSIADPTPFTALMPQVPPTLNPPGGPFAAASRAIDWRGVDRNPGQQTALLQAMLHHGGSPGLQMTGGSVADQWRAFTGAGVRFAGLFSGVPPSTAPGARVATPASSQTVGLANTGAAGIAPAVVGLPVAALLLSGRLGRRWRRSRNGQPVNRGLRRALSLSSTGPAVSGRGNSTSFGTTLSVSPGGADGEVRTPGQRFTKPLLYH